MVRSALFILLFVSFHQLVQLEDPADLQLYRYNTEIKVISSLLAKECPGYIKDEKRELTDLQRLDLEVKASQVQYLKQQLLKCRKDSASTKGIPRECVTATDLTQYWRRDHDGRKIYGGGPNARLGHACDLRASLGWFRFSGAAGTHMLDKCPKPWSCGTKYPNWSDDTPPHAVGVVGMISTHQGFIDGNCSYWTHDIEVMRCSWNTPHDLIYRYPGSFVPDHTNACDGGFCGML